MITIVAVDDDSEFSHDLKRLGKTIEGSFRDTVEVQQINPNDFGGKSGRDAASSTLFAAVQNVAERGCDVFAVDIQLKDTGVNNASNLALALEVANVFRKYNRTAILFLYSGTLSKFIKLLLAQDTTAKQKVAEANLRTIFQNQVAEFVSRDDLEGVVILALRDLPMPLRIEKELSSHKQRRVRGEESVFKGRSFQELASEVRRQSNLGRQIIEIVTKHGVAALVDLNL